jgi:hypothetical protein
MSYYTIVVKKNVYIVGESCFRMRKWKHFGWTNHLPMKKIAPIGKSTFNYFVGFCETQLTILAQGLLDHEYMLWEKLAKFKGGGNLKSMLEFCYDCKKYVQIRHKISLVFKAYINKPYTILNE